GRRRHTRSKRDWSSDVCSSDLVIRKHTGVTAEFFAYPYGLWNGRVRDAVCRAGYRAAFTLDYSDGSSTTDPWALPRLNVPASIRSEERRVGRERTSPRVRRSLL